MSLLWEKMKEYYRQPIKSKMMFNGDFHKLLEEIIAEIEIRVSREVIPKYGVMFTQYGDQIIKIKIKDKDLMIEKLIACNMDYSKNDERYGYVTPKFSSEEKNAKPRKYKLDKFSITDKEIIVDSFMERLLEIIEEF